MGKPPSLRRVELNGLPVAFATGGGTGAALTTQGELWTWGAQRGKPSLKYRQLMLREKIRRIFGGKPDFLQPDPVVDPIPRKLAE